MALDLVGGGSSTSAPTTVASGGSQIAQKGGQVTNPNSFALGTKASYVSPGGTTISGVKGNLTIQPGIDSGTLASILATVATPSTAAPSLPAAPSDATLAAATNTDPGSAIVNSVAAAAAPPSSLSTVFTNLTTNAKIGIGLAVAALVFFLIRALRHR